MSTNRCVAACCSVLQCVAVWCCSALQIRLRLTLLAVCEAATSVLQCAAVCCSVVLQCIANTFALDSVGSLRGRHRSSFPLRTTKHLFHTHPRVTHTCVTCINDSLNASVTRTNRPITAANYGAATSSRLPKMIGHFCKRAL